MKGRISGLLLCLWLFVVVRSHDEVLFDEEDGSFQELKMQFDQTGEKAAEEVRQNRGRFQPINKLLNLMLSERGT